MNISFKKTKTQVFNDNLMAAEPSLITVDGHEVENVRQFEYLGHIFDNCSVARHRKARAELNIARLELLLSSISYEQSSVTSKSTEELGGSS